MSEQRGYKNHAGDGRRKGEENCTLGIGVSSSIDDGDRVEHGGDDYQLKVKLWTKTIAASLCKYS